jgi:SAM-dependent methyltransferase
LDSVPVLLRDRISIFSFWNRSVESAGPHVEVVTGLIMDGRGQDALVKCLGYTPRLPILERLPGWRLWHSGPVPALGRKWIERKVRGMISSGFEKISAEDWFDFYYGRNTATGSELLPYYLNRFTLPRGLAAFALLQLLPPSDKPVLDLACGFGHFGHYLSRRPHAVGVVGVDFNFFQLWCAKQFIAPRANFVCADAHDKLPFANETFSAVLCSDAFQIIEHKEELLRELERCAPGRPWLFPRTANRLVRPNTAYELAPGEYLELFGDRRPRVFGEYQLVRDYLNRVNPLSPAPVDSHVLRWDKWLTVVANTDSMEQVAIDRATPWPHEVGDININPVYQRTSIGGDRYALRFKFPTTWFAYQNSEMHAYHANRMEFEANTVMRARAGARDPEVQRLIEEFVLVGLPRRYLRMDGQPASGGVTRSAEQ